MFTFVQVRISKISNFIVNRDHIVVICKKQGNILVGNP